MNRPFYALLFISAILFTACSSESETELLGADTHQKVVLAFNFQDFVQRRGTRNTSSEDNLGRISVFIFNSTTAEKVYEDNFQVAYAYQVKIKPGTYDLYFIANKEILPLNVLTRDDLDRQIQEKRRFTDYYGNSGFSMARVYKAQQINSGGTMMNPQKFTPELAINNPLAPISSFGQDKSSAGLINLVRTIARVSVNLEGEGVPYVTKLEYVNASSEYSLGQLANDAFSQPIVENILIQKVNVGYLDNYAPIYIPERLFSKHENVGWHRDPNKDVDEPIGHVNYIQVTMYDGAVYKIPIISNGNGIAGNYLDFARDASKADYNIIRNFDYQYKITVPLANRELQIESIVEPWKVVESGMSFTKPEIDFGFVGGQFDSDVLLVDNLNSIDFTLKIKNSNGLIWRVVLSNGLDFELVPSKSASVDVPAIIGVGSEDTTYGFTLRPLKPYQGTPRFTELYLLVNGKETSLYNNEDGVGPGKRFLIKQVQIN